MFFLCVAPATGAGRVARMSEHRDVVILGGGAIGLACALALLRSGRGVTVLERGVVGHGSSHGNCGTLTPSLLPLNAPGTVAKGLKWLLKADAPLRITPLPSPALLLWLLAFAGHCNAADYQRVADIKGDLALRSRALLERWVNDEALDCEFAASGHLTVYRDAAALAQSADEVALWRKMGVAVETLDGDACRAREPALNAAVIGGHYHPGDAQLRPDRYVAELARAVRAGGGEIREHCEVRELRRDAGRISAIDTPDGPIHADQVVLALGAWSPLLGRQLGLRLPIQPGKGYSITYARPSRPPQLPLVLKERSVCVTSWGSGYRLGSTMEFAGYDASLNRRRLDALKRGAAEYLQEPEGPVVEEEWYGWRPMTTDDLPIIGRASRLTNLTLATGHGMLGITLSAITGQLIADLLNGRPTDVDLTPLSPARFGG